MPGDTIEPNDQPIDNDQDMFNDDTPLDSGDQIITVGAGDNSFEDMDEPISPDIGDNDTGAGEGQKPAPALTVDENAEYDFEGEKVPGKDILEAYKKRYHQQADYTRKTQELAQFRRDVTAFKEELEQNHNRMFSDPNHALEEFRMYAPDVLHRMMETYADEVAALYDLREKDMGAYYAKMSQIERERQEKLKRVETDRSKREKQRKVQNERADNLRNTVQTRGPEALSKAGLSQIGKDPDANIWQKFVDHLVKNYDGDDILDSPMLLDQAAKELAEDPLVKAFVASQKKPSKPPARKKIVDSGNDLEYNKDGGLSDGGPIWR